MRLDEFRKIKLIVIKNDTVIYEGEAEEMSDELKALNTIRVNIQPGLAQVTVEDIKFDND